MSIKYLLGVKINTNLLASNVLSMCEEVLQKPLTDNESNLICTTNPEFIMRTRKDKAFLNIINNSFLSLPDGFGVLLGLRFKKHVASYMKLPVYIKAPLHIFVLLYTLIESLILPSSFGVTVTGADLVDNLCDFASKRSYSVGFVGGWPKDALGRSLETSSDIASQAAACLKSKYPTLEIAFATSQFSSSTDADERCIAEIKKQMTLNNMSKVDIVFVAFAFGEQEKWFVRNSNLLNAKIGLGVGGTFDYISGHVKRAPHIIRKFHFEWLFRLLKQPYRVRRTFIALFVFLYNVYTASLVD